MGNFECGMVFGARVVVLSNSETTDGSKKRKYLMTSSALEEKTLLMSEVRGE